MPAARRLSPHIPLLNVPRLGRADLPRTNVDEAVADHRRIHIVEEAEHDALIGHVVDDIAEDGRALPNRDRGEVPSEERVKLWINVARSVRAPIAILSERC